MKYINLPKQHNSPITIKQKSRILLGVKEMKLGESQKEEDYLDSKSGNQ